MGTLRDLYQQIILDHNRSPRNFRIPEGANREARGDNPLCGDKIALYVRVGDGGVIEDVGFQGSGCAISQASASLMTAAVKGGTVQQAEVLFRAFHEMVTCGSTGSDDTAGASPAQPSLGKLAAFAGVREFPARVKCANLPWHTLHAALAGADAAVSTE